MKIGDGGRKWILGHTRRTISILVKTRHTEKNKSQGLDLRHTKQITTDAIQNRYYPYWPWQPTKATCSWWCIVGRESGFWDTTLPILVSVCLFVCLSVCLLCILCVCVSVFLLQLLAFKQATPKLIYLPLFLLCISSCIGSISSYNSLLKLLAIPIHVLLDTPNPNLCDALLSYKISMSLLWAFQTCDSIVSLGGSTLQFVG